MSNEMIDFLSYERQYLRFPHPITSLVRVRDIDLDLRMRPVDRAWAKKAGFQGLNAMNALRGLVHMEATLPEGLRVRSDTSRTS